MAGKSNPTQRRHEEEDCTADRTLETSFQYQQLPSALAKWMCVNFMGHWTAISQICSCYCTASCYRPPNYSLAPTTDGVVLSSHPLAFYSIAVAIDNCLLREHRDRGNSRSDCKSNINLKEWGGEEEVESRRWLWWDWENMLKEWMEYSVDELKQPHFSCVARTPSIAEFNNHTFDIVKIDIIGIHSLRTQSTL